MKNIIDKLEQVTSNYYPRLTQIGEDSFSAKPFPGKWSKKEILGHLVDSAQNNIRRFVVAQYEDIPFIKYNQDIWVTAAGYQDYDTKNLLELWALLNRHAVAVLKNMSAATATKLCMTNEPRTLEWLAGDYNKHLLHHLHQILDLDEIAYP